MSSLFNPQITLAPCTFCNGDGYERDENDSVVSIGGIDQRCQCFLPNQYLNANIGFEYWPINEKNFQGEQEDLDKIACYFNKIAQLKQEGRGFYISGPAYGTGKTTLGIMFLKKVLETTKYNALFIPCSELVIINAKFMQNHYDTTLGEKIDYIKNVDFLMIDDLGKEFDDNKDWSRAALNSILRYRAMWKKITIFTSNLEIDTIAGIYGGSNHSIINGYSIVLPVNNRADYRKTRKVEKLANDKKAKG